MKVSEIITENTGISISVLILIIGFASWLTTIYNDNAAQAVSISRLDQANMSLQKDIQQILITTTETKSKVEILLEKQNKEK